MIEQLLLNGIIAGSIYSLVALGFSLIYQTTRFFPAYVRRRRTSAGQALRPRCIYLFGRPCNLAGGDEGVVCLSYTKVYICIQK